jgi:predicted transcriptional regulator
MTNTTSPSTQLKHLPAKQRAQVLIKLGVLKAPKVKKYRVKTKPPSTGKPTSTYRRPIECIETGEVFASITAAAQAHGVKPSNLCWHLKGYHTSVGGKTYRHTTLPTPAIPHDQRARRKVKCLDDGQTFPSITQAAEHYGLSPNSVSLHLRGVQRSAKGKRFEYV